MRFDTLAEWLSWQESLNPREIDLGLDRVRRVLQQLGYRDRFDCPLISVAGTNGKGSVVAYLEAIARAAGKKVCSYTSPHLLRYNERIRIDGDEIGDRALCEAFDRIDKARGNVELTYFEFGTLAAIDLFLAARPDLVVMEIGLGGRLDAVNIMQPDVAVITTVAIDHTDWLGNDRESIGFEKAGILRAGRAAVCGDYAPPRSLLEHAAHLQARMKLIGKDYRVQRRQQHWRLLSDGDTVAGLPPPALAGAFQIDNAATAIVALQALDGFGAGADAIRKGLRTVSLAGRFQIIRQQPRVIVDVAHNPAAAAALASQLSAEPCAGRTHAVVAMRADKAVAEVVTLMAGQVDCWYTAGLVSAARGLPGPVMAETVERLCADVKLSAASTVAEACALALAAAAEGDRMIVFGSFHTVAEAMQFFASQP